MTLGELAKLPGGPHEYGKDWWSPFDKDGNLDLDLASWGIVGAIIKAFEGEPYKTGVVPGWSVKGAVKESAQIPDVPFIHESMCGNCRRDWHKVPLTENLARMFDGVDFPEDYAPGLDVSRVVCPGSEFHGPAVDYPGSTFEWEKTVVHKIVTWPNPHLPAPAAPWVVFKEEEGPESAVAKTLEDAFPAVTVKTWLPGDEDMEQAALEAAPKAIEMKHKPPKSPGLDFSDFKIDLCYQPPKGNKKK